MQTLDKTARFPYSRGEYLRRAAWLCVGATLFRLPLPRAAGWRRMILRLFGAEMGTASAVHQSVKIIHPWLLRMGHWSIIGPRVLVYNLGMIEIGSHSVVSQGSHLCAGTHDYTDPTLPLERPPIVVGDGVWIATDAFIGPGVTVGHNSVVAARAVVTKDVPEAVVVGGNPAKVIKPRVMKETTQDPSHA